MEQLNEIMEEKYMNLPLRKGIIISFCIYLSYLTYYLFTSVERYKYEILSLTIYLVIFITLYILLLKGKFDLTRRLFIYLSVLFITNQSFIIEGRVSGVHYFLLIFGSLSFSIINIKRIWTSFLFFFIILLLFSIVEFNLFPYSPLVVFPKNVSHTIRIISIISTFSITFYISYLIFKINSEKTDLITTKTKELIETNSSLEKSKKLVAQQNKKMLKLNDALQTNLDLISYQKKELEKSNADKDKLFSLIAHDLKNPISALIGLSELIQMNLDNYSPERLRLLLKQINDSANRINILLVNLLNWARAQNGQIKTKKTVFSLMDILEENKKLFKQNLIDKQIELSVFCPANTLLYADKNMMDTVIRNLISNAIKFTHSKGRIIVYCEAEENRTKLNIKDSGVGMTKFTMDRLFKSDANISTTGTNNEQGMGLGLLICKEFLELNGCELQIESQPNEGSTFSILFPEVNSEQHQPGY